MAPYTIDAVLGGGGFASVVVARRASGERRALKVLHRSRCSDATSVGRFRDEARILERIRHPTVVGFHGLHHYGDRLVMELDFVDGLPLDRVLGPAPHRLAMADTLEIVRTVAEALWSAYADPWGEDGAPMHIVHRDVHPANIMLDRAGKVWVLDFGIAKGSFDGREAMSLHDVGGALGYIAPERKDGTAGPPVDVYALAAMVVHLGGDRLLLPQRPARHDEVAAEVVERNDLDGQAPGLGALLREMLSFDPEARPSMDDVARRLATILAGIDVPDLPGLAARTVVPELDGRARREPRKHRRYRDVAFLEEEVPDEPLGALTVTEARRRLRAILAKPDWVRRIDEVKRVSRASDPWVETPLLDLLARVSPAWWRPLARTTTPEEAEAALLILGDRPSASTLAAAGELAEHPNERVRKAARFVLERGAS